MDSLKGSFVVAMPQMADPRFKQTVVLVCEHNKDGALGIIVNKPMDGIRFDDICRQLNIATPKKTPPVYYGGPVASERGFIIHNGNCPNGDESLKVTDSLCLSASQLLLESIGNGRGPEKFLFALGYSGWGAGQLEREIADDGWLIVPADARIIFETSDARKWKASAGLFGIDIALIGGKSGNA
ncbi:MAG: YqgE/AlgH family protein [Nitrospirae bacterium]|nr:YqgE/AlgH family protein [Nitrospirota bacterium]